MWDTCKNAPDLPRYGWLAAWQAQYERAARLDAKARAKAQARAEREAEGEGEWCETNPAWFMAGFSACLRNKMFLHSAPKNSSGVAIRVIVP